MTDAEHPIRVIQASKRYKNHEVLSRVDLSVRRGEIHAIVGLNGAGKTTLMRLILGMTGASDGRVVLNGTDVDAVTSAGWGSIGHLIETPLAYPELTVQQNLVAAARLAGLAPAPAGESARTLADEFVLAKWWKKRVRTLSLGNRQRLGLAIALIADPRLLVIDEPTNALDPAGVLVVREALQRRVREYGMTVLVSSHHLDEVARIADRITVMSEGRIVGSLDPQGIDLERSFFSLAYAAVSASFGAGAGPEEGKLSS